ncbi:MAG TPA: DUF3093 domain-containing protein [Streptosporangiaceae bacterium]|nr:DUF3093 domain-containing protein [Streptosporangiaceae bacterium]
MRVYHERLRVPASWWVLGLGSALMLGAGFLAGFDWEPALAVYAAITVPLAAFLVGWGWLCVEVRGGELRVGKARLPLAQAGPVSALDEDQTRALRGPRSDPAAFLLARPYLPRAVYIPVDDPAGVTPYWLIGTRRPAELAAAIDAARPAARAGGAPVG